MNKTNFVLFHTFNKPIKENITLKINRIAIQEQKYIKYLGVLLDSTLSWNVHLDNLTKKITRSIGIMYKIRPFVPNNILIKLYYALIYPHLLYAIQVWGSTFDKYINPLFILQKKVVRLISHVKIKDDNGNCNHSSLLFKDLRVLKIKDIFRNQIALLVFDCLQGTSYQEYKQVSILNSNVHHYATRNNLFVIDKCKILEKKNCLCHIVEL